MNRKNSPSASVGLQLSSLVELLLILTFAVPFGAVAQSQTNICSATEATCTGVSSVAEGFCTAAAPGDSLESCCPASTSADALVGVKCASTSRFETITSTSRVCASDGSSAKCDGSGVIQGICRGVDCTGCSPATDILAIECATGTGVGIIPNATSGSCQWIYGEQWALVACIDRQQVAVGACASPTNKWCGGQAYGVYCCGLVDPVTKTASSTQSPTASFTPSLELSTSNSLSLSASAASTTASNSQSEASQSVSKSETSSNAPTLSPEATATSEPTGTASPSQGPTPTEVVKTGTHSSTIPSPTVRPTVSPSLSLVSLIDVEPSNSLSSRLNGSAIRASALTVNFTLYHGHWRPQIIPHLGQYIYSSQANNPKGFTARQPSLLSSVSLASPTEVVFQLNADPCYEPQGPREFVLLGFPSVAIDPSPTNTDMLWVTVPVEADSVTTSSIIGVSIGGATVLFAFLTCVAGDPSAGLHVMSFLQMVVLISSNTALRWGAAGYVQWLTWVHSPFWLLLRPIYMALVHLGLALLVLVVTLWYGRWRVRGRKWFPSLVGMTLWLFLPGALYQSWVEILESPDAETESTTIRTVFVFFSIVLVVLFGGVALAFSFWVGRKRNMAYTRYSSGRARSIFRGYWGPPFLYTKYGPFLGCYDQRWSLFYFVTMAVWCVTSCLAALNFSDPRYCYAVFVILASMHVLRLCVVVVMRPGRTRPHAVVLSVSQVAPLCVISGVLGGLGLQCGSDIVGRYAEIATLVSLCCVLLAGIVAFVGRLVERQAAAKAALGAVQEDDTEIDFQRLVEEAETKKAKGHHHEEEGDEEMKPVVVPAESGESAADGPARANAPTQEEQAEPGGGRRQGSEDKKQEEKREGSSDERLVPQGSRVEARGERTSSLAHYHLTEEVEEEEDHPSALLRPTHSIRQQARSIAAPSSSHHHRPVNPVATMKLFKSFEEDIPPEGEIPLPPLSPQSRRLEEERAAVRARSSVSPDAESQQRAGASAADYNKCSSEHWQHDPVRPPPRLAPGGTYDDPSRAPPHFRPNLNPVEYHRYSSSPDRRPPLPLTQQRIRDHHEQYRYSPHGHSSTERELWGADGENLPVYGDDAVLSPQHRGTVVRMRREILGRMNPAEHCPGCGRWQGQNRLCDDCAYL